MKKYIAIALIFMIEAPTQIIASIINRDKNEPKTILKKKICVKKKASKMKIRSWKMLIIRFAETPTEYPWIELLELLNSASDYADLEIRDVENKTPLLIAAECGNIGAVHALLRAGAKQYATTNDGKNILHLAAEKGFNKIVQGLLSTKFKTDKLDDEGNSAAKLARKNGHIKTALLIETAKK